MVRKSTLKYIIVGISGTLLYLALLTIQIELLNIEIIIATITSYIVIIIGSYYLSYSWVFNSREKHLNAFVRYIVVVGLGFIINTMGMYLSIHVFDFWYLASQGVLLCMVAINNYLMNKLWAFKDKEYVSSVC